VQGGLDAGGTVEPTPFCDIANAGICAARGQWVDAGLTISGVVPYFGDAGKAVKHARKLAEGTAEVADTVNDLNKAADLAGDLKNVHVPSGPNAGSTRHIELEHADNGGYKIEFDSGMGYAGKGGTSRARQSARRHSRENNDPVKKIDHFPADNDKDAFDIEATFLNELGGHKSPRNYNQIDSPGTPF
jgi:hypothetical protein